MPKISRKPLAERTWRTPGRKPKLMPNEATFRLITRIGRLNATKAELASALGVAVHTLDQFFEVCPEAQQAYEDAKLASNVSLRRAQHKRALKGSDQMLIWLGKNQLGQSDKVEVGGEGIQPVTFQIVGLPIPGAPQPTLSGGGNGQPAIEGTATRIGESG